MSSIAVGYMVGGLMSTIIMSLGCNWWQTLLSILIGTIVMDRKELFGK